jgi:hypothetical protein
LERETGVEPATSSLARKHSTTELLPLYRFKYNGHVQYGQRATESNINTFLILSGTMGENLHLIS